MSTIPIHGDISLVPQRYDFELRPLPLAEVPQSRPGVLKITGERALALAEERWGLEDSHIDPIAGVARAYVTMVGDPQPRNQNMKVWIVTARMDFQSQGPRGNPRFVTHRLCIMIDAESGKHILSYRAMKGYLP